MPYDEGEVRDVFQLLQGLGFDPHMINPSLDGHPRICVNHLHALVCPLYGVHLRLARPES